jgi:hypothetical protein
LEAELRVLVEIPSIRDDAWQDLVRILPNFRQCHHCVTIPSLFSFRLSKMLAAEIRPSPARIPCIFVAT